MNEEYRYKLENEFIQIFFAQSTRHSHFSEYPRTFTQTQKVNLITISYARLVVTHFAYATTHSLTTALVNTKNTADIDDRAKKILSLLPKMSMKDFQKIMLNKFFQHTCGSSMDQDKIILFCKEIVSSLVENMSVDIHHLTNCIRHCKVASNQDLADIILAGEMLQ